MADKKISELTELTTPDGTEELVVNDGGVSRKITQANLFKGIDNTAADATAITIDASENVSIVGNVSLSKTSPKVTLGDSSATTNNLTTAEITTYDGTWWSKLELDASEVLLQAYGTTRLTLAGTEATFNSNVRVGDNQSISSGAGNDLSLTHTGTYSALSNFTGDLYFDQAVASGSTYFRNYNSASALKTCIRAGGTTPYVDLYYDGVIKLSTISAGVTIPNRLLVGDTSNATSATIHTIATAGAINGVGVEATTTAGTGAMVFFNPNGQVGSIITSGVGTTFGTTSDYRLKENVVPMTGSIDRLKALKPSRFNFKADTETTVDGFLAHEAGEVVPECVSGTKDAMKDEGYEVTPAVLDVDGTVTTEAVMGTRTVPDHQFIDQSKLVPLLVASLQEAVAKIEALEARVTALEV